MWTEHNNKKIHPNVDMLYITRVTWIRCKQNHILIMAQSSSVYLHVYTSNCFLLYSSHDIPATLYNTLWEVDEGDDDRILTCS